MFIITGGGSGIGQALAKSLTKRGQSVLIIGRHEETLKETRAYSSLIESLCADVSSEEGLLLIQQALRDKTSIQGLVNNAGTLEPIGPISEIQMKDWHHTLNTNLNAALFLPQKLQTQLQNGRVLNIGSGAAYFPIKAWAAYCTSKAALSMLTRCWQLESHSIAFASVMPGIIDTKMQERARNDLTMDPNQIHFYMRLKKHNRLLSPETVAAFLTWLLLDVATAQFVEKEWDIYDISHHKDWLKPPHQVLHWDF